MAVAWEPLSILVERLWKYRLEIGVLVICFFSYVEFILKFKFINDLFSSLISDSVSGEKEKLRSFE